jgi:hypothetical protein
MLWLGLSLSTRCRFSFHLLTSKSKTLGKFATANPRMQGDMNLFHRGQREGLERDAVLRGITPQEAKRIGTRFQRNDNRL